MTSVVMWQRIKAWRKRRRMAREVGRMIPWSDDLLFRDDERVMWERFGWRVDYWVCPTCGARRGEGAAAYPILHRGNGWAIPSKTCDCPGR